MEMATSGLLLVDKSPSWTSHHVVSHIRKILKKQFQRDIRVGHLGTLDPFASGLLPILIGGVTRLSDEMMDGKKQYLFQISLGKETDSLDTTGQEIKTASVPPNASELFEKITPQFRGEIEQVPPVYSALKMQGRPLYEYMRAEGKLPFDIQTKKRLVLIHHLDFLGVDKANALATFRVLCGKGTYVRSLARDLCVAIGTVGHCFSLRREIVAPWSVEGALLFSEENKPTEEEIQKNILLPEKIFPHWIKISVPQEHTKIFSAGNIISLNLDSLCLSEEKKTSLLKDGLCFGETLDGAILYFCRIEKIDDFSIKIKPYKKIN